MKRRNSHLMVERIMEERSICSMDCFVCCDPGILTNYKKVILSALSSLPNTLLLPPRCSYLPKEAVFDSLTHCLTYLVYPFQMTPELLPRLQLLDAHCKQPDERAHVSKIFVACVNDFTERAKVYHMTLE